MLQRATSGLSAPRRWVTWRRGLVTGPTSVLLKYVAILALLTTVGCFYIWQTSNLREVLLQTRDLRTRRVLLEQQNVNLVNQLALWNTPAYVDQRSKADGYGATGMHISVRVGDGEQPAQTTGWQR